MAAIFGHGKDSARRRHAISPGEMKAVAVRTDICENELVEKREGLTMTKVAIFPVPGGEGGVAYLAMGRDKRSEGATPGEALDGLTRQLTQDEAGTLVVIQSQRPDRFFNADQQNRLRELMDQWRACRAKGQALPAAEQAELDKLTAEELAASACRAAELMQ